LNEPNDLKKKVCSFCSPLQYMEKLLEGFHQKP